MNILVSSYNCSPYRGSEEKLSWSTVKEYAMRDYTTYVVTNAVYKNELKKYIRENIEDMPFLKNIHFYYIDQPDLLKKAKGHLGMMMRYWYFQRNVIFAPKATRARRFSYTISRV